MTPLEWMKKTWDKYKDLTVKAINLPAPPTPAHGVIYMPSCWDSKTFDKTFQRSEEIKVVSMEQTRLGPAVLLYTKLGTLIDHDAEENDCCLIAENSTICATVSSFSLFKDKGGITYADEASLDNMSITHRSCHPGSHYVIPHAPHLTAFLQYAQAPNIKEGDRGNNMRITYFTPEEGEAIFGYCNFKSNEIVDEYVSKCVIDLDVSFFNTSGGLGPWARPFLRTMRGNLALIGGSEHERWLERANAGFGLTSQEDVGKNVSSAHSGILSA